MKLVVLLILLIPIFSGTRIQQSSQPPNSLVKQIQIFNLDSDDTQFHQQFPDGKLMTLTGPVWSGKESLSGATPTSKWLYIYEWIDSNAVDNSIALEVWAKPSGGYHCTLFPMDVGVTWRIVLPNGYQFNWSASQGMAFFDL